MENILGIIGTITGVLGLLVSVLLTVLVTRWQAKEHTKEMEMERAEREKERAHNERLERLAFLADRIFDISIPRGLRLPFYEEYISMKGNGTAVKFWLMEENRERAAGSK